ncbi:hypothetical protein [Streptomyces sp. AC495_CC817]|uniref:hypothetical protein n=1 Tax=Streptomyces sp. AC495_CC817 TaxID=2823900 RepID=UPI001C27C291|nr:hypothetical protein [Streptomyces sp. AC495_CC817]
MTVMRVGLMRDLREPDPVHRLGCWQREQLHHWRAVGRIEHSPLLRAAMTCVLT